MATSTIPNPNKIEAISLTINSSTSGSGTITVCGRVATLSASIHAVSGIGNGVAWIPGAKGSDANSHLYPMSTIWLSCDSYDASGTRATGEAWMGADGVLYVSTANADEDLKISGSWITKG